MPRPPKQEVIEQLSNEEKARVRQLLFQNSGLLKRLSALTNGAGVYEILAGAELAQINLVGYVLHLVCIGAIPISRANFELLHEHRRRKVLTDTFQSVGNYKQFEDYPRDVKVQKLRLVGLGVAIALRALFDRSMRAAPLEGPE